MGWTNKQTIWYTKWCNNGTIMVIQWHTNGTTIVQYNGTPKKSVNKYQ